MAFWSNAGLEPLRQFRWTVVFGAGANNGMDNQVFALKKVDRPKATVKDIAHSYLNHKFYYPGRLEWETVSMTIAAVPEGHTSGFGTTQVLMTTLKEAGYTVPTGNDSADKLKTIKKDGFSNGLGTSIIIKHLGADGNAFEGFELHNPFFTSIQFGSLDYSSEEIVEVQCTLRYDYAILVDGNGQAIAASNPKV